MRINIIAAVDRNRAIGKENKLLYWLPNDLKRFKLLTTGHTIVMGRKTFESLPKGALPNRRNVVVSRSVTELPGCDVYPSIDEALKSCSAQEDVYIPGGESVYRQALPRRREPTPSSPTIPHGMKQPVKPILPTTAIRMTMLS